MKEIETRQSKLSLWLPVGIWMGLVFGMSAVSSLPEVPVLGDVDWGDKISHAISYAVGGALIWRALEGRACSWKRVWMAVLVTGLYGLTDEIHQLYVPGRAFDLGADVTGAAVSAVFLTLKTGGYEDDRGTAGREDLRSEGQEAG